MLRFVGQNLKSTKVPGWPLVTCFQRPLYRSLDKDTENLGWFGWGCRYITTNLFQSCLSTDLKLLKTKEIKRFGFWVQFWRMWQVLEIEYMMTWQKESWRTERMHNKRDNPKAPNLTLTFYILHFCWQSSEFLGWFLWRSKRKKSHPNWSGAPWFTSA